MLAGRSSNDAKANELINEAIMCKMFKCRPSQLEEEDWYKIELFNLIYTEVAKENPLSLLM